MGRTIDMRCSLGLSLYSCRLRLTSRYFEQVCRAVLHAVGLIERFTVRQLRAALTL